MKGFWDWLFDSDKVPLAILCNTVFFTVFLAFLMLLVNYVTINTESAHGMDVVVTEKYTDTRYHTKRVGRNRYVRGTPYQVYGIRFMIPEKGNTVKSMEIPLGKYQSVRKGDTLHTIHAKGGLWMDVYRPDSVAHSIKAQKRKKKRPPYTTRPFPRYPQRNEEK